MTASVDEAGLRHWKEVAQEPWPSILVGNGASRAVWEGFSYESLFDTAQSVDLVADPLTDRDLAIFGGLRTTNLERVLGALQATRIVAEALGSDVKVIQRHYRSISRALVQAVRAVHIPWATASRDMLLSIRKATGRHESVFSTNYDLLLYWSIMAEGPRPPDFKDFFWAECDSQLPDWVCFDEWDTDVTDDATLVYYLHGGIHLYDLPWAGSAKRVAREGENLLDTFSHIVDTEEEIAPIPLFVAEGTHEDKLRVIDQSAYLRFAYTSFRQDDSPIVVFGHSLGSEDAHIVDALAETQGRRIAISVRPDDPVTVRTRIHEYSARLPEARLVFFDSTTHPLGSPGLGPPQP